MDVAQSKNVLVVRTNDRAWIGAEELNVSPVSFVFGRPPQFVPGSVQVSKSTEEAHSDAFALSLVLCKDG